MTDIIREIFRKYKWRIIAVAGGLLFAILIFTIGFWRTLLLALIVAFAYLMGMLLDQGGRARVAEFFAAIFKKQ